MAFRVTLTVCSGMEGVGTARRPCYEQYELAYETREDAFKDAKAEVARGWTVLPNSRFDPEGRVAVLCRILAAEVEEV